jgi:hypothetical protein
MPVFAQIFNQFKADKIFLGFLFDNQKKHIFAPKVAREHTPSGTILVLHRVNTL